MIKFAGVCRCHAQFRLAVMTMLLLTGTSASADITGQVSSSTLATGVQGVDVVAVDAADPNTEVTRTTTDSNGDYTLTLSGTPPNVKVYTDSRGQPRGLVDEAYNAVGNPDCFEEDCTDNRANGSSLSSSAGGINFSLDDGAFAFGTVTEEGSGNPIAGVQVCFHDTETTPPTPASNCATTDAGGQYRTPAAFTFNSFAVTTETVPGSYVAEVFHDTFDNVYFIDTNSPEADYLDGTVLGGNIFGHQADFALIEGGTIFGDVTNAGGSPLTNSTVKITNGDGSIELSFSCIGGCGKGSKGVSPDYQTGNLPPDNYYLFAKSSAGGGPWVSEIYDGLDGTFCTDTGFPSNCEQRVIDEGAKVTVVAQMDQRVDHRLNQGFMVFGDAYVETTPDMHASAPAQFATVCAFFPDGRPTGQCGQTSEASGYSLGPVPDGVALTYKATPQNNSTLMPELFDGVDPFEGASFLDFTMAATRTPPGTNVTGVDFTLQTGSRISGTINANSLQIQVEVYTESMPGQFDDLVYAKDFFVGSTLPYNTHGLPDANYKVVFNALDDPDAGDGTRYLDEIYPAMICPGGTQCFPSQFGNTIALSGDINSIDATPTVGGRVSGTVQDDGLNPLVGVEVTVRDIPGNILASAFTDDVGYYETWPIPGGHFVISEVPEFLNQFFDGAQCTDGDCVTNFANDRDTISPTSVNTSGPVSQPNIDFTLTQRTYTFSGTVTDGTDPLNMVDVCLYEAGVGQVGCVATDGSGNYTTSPAVLSGNYVLVASLAEFIPETQDGTVCDPCTQISQTPIFVDEGVASGGSSSDVESTDFALTRRTYTISGTVEDDMMNLLSGATVCLFDDMGVQVGSCDTTTGGGAFAFTGLTNGTYHATASQTEHEDELYSEMACNACDVTTGTAINVNEGVGDASAIDFTLMPSTYSISGTVTDDVLTALDGATVCLFDNVGVQVGSCDTTAGGGAFSFSGLSNGTYYATASMTEHEDELYSELACNACDVTTGTAINVNEGVGDATAIDFTLMPSTYSISGTVTDDVLTALDGATVCLFDNLGVQEGSCDTTAGGGVFSFSGLSNGTYYATASMTEHEDELYSEMACNACDVTTGTAIDVHEGVGDATAIDFTLTPKTYSISGTINDSAIDGFGGGPLDAVTVELFLDPMAKGAALDTFVTSTDGTYTFSGHSAGDYFVQATRNDFQTASSATVGVGEMDGGDAMNIDIAMDPVIYSVQGQITDGTDPIAGANVCLIDVMDGMTPITCDGTDGLGDYSLGTRFGDYIVEASQTDFDTGRYMSGSAVTVDSMTTTASTLSGIDIALTPTQYMVTGTVFDDMGAPVQGAMVTAAEIMAKSPTDTTDTNGDFTLLLEAGTYDITIDGVPDFDDEVVTGVQVGSAVGGDVMLGSINLTATLYNITGLVQDADTMADIDGALVELLESPSENPTGITTTTATDGTYTLQARAGTYVVRATATEFETTQHAFQVTVGPDQMMIDIQMPPVLYIIEGNVLDDGGAPIEGADVRLEDLGGTDQGLSTLTDATGHYQHMIRAGSYVATANADRFEPGQSGSVDVDSVNGNATMVDITLSLTTATISGTVDDGTNPVSGATVDLYFAPPSKSADKGLPLDSRTTDGTGFYEFADIPLDDYELVVNATGFDEQRAVVNLTGPDVTQDFSLGETIYTVTGTVTDAETMDPLEGVTVTATAQVSAKGLTIITQDMTNASGTYTLQLPTDQYQIVAVLTGYTDVEANGGAPLTIDSNVSGLDFAMSLAEGAISGTVLDAADSATLGGIKLQAFDTAGDPAGASQRSGSDGTYLLTLPEGDYYVLAVGNERGYISEIYAGDGVEGIACPQASCGSSIMNGMLVSVVDGAETMMIDFELASGEIFSGDDLAADADGIGSSVAICGSRAVIGAPGDDEAGPDAGAIFVYRKQGTGFVLERKILPTPDGGLAPDGGRFGAAVSCSNGTIVVGAPGVPGVAKTTGTVDKSMYIFQMTAGGSPAINQLQQVVQSNLGGNVSLTGDTGFGTSVSVSGNTMAVGAPRSGSGTAAVLQFNTGSSEPWGLTTMLTDATASPGAQFGASMAVSNGMVVVGAPNQSNEQGLSSGVASMFTGITGNPNWTQVGKFTNAGANTGDQFAQSISFDGNTIAVGAPGADTTSQDGGAAYIFQVGGGNFTQVATLTPGDNNAGDAFGSSVSLANGQVAVGAANGDGATTDSGSAFVFDGTQGWSQIQEIIAAGGLAGDGFGSAIAFDGTGVLVGAPNAAVQGVNTGSAQAVPSADTLFRGTFEGQ